MKNVIWVISGLVFLVSTVQQVKTNTDANAKPGASAMVKLVSDEDPIIVRGHVKNTGGSAIAGASVKLKKNGVVTNETTTDASGEYIMGGVLSGNYVLRLAASGYVTKNIDIPVTEEVVRIDTLIAE